MTETKQKDCTEHIWMVVEWEIETHSDFMGKFPSAMYAKNYQCQKCLQFKDLPHWFMGNKEV